MPRKIISFAISVLLIFPLAGNSAFILAIQSKDKQLAVQDKPSDAQRQRFASGRDLLLNQHIPFEPEELLREGWREKLKPTLEAIPEMHQNRYETAPLKGAYMADTLYLPENVRLSGHTIVLANYVVFEGKKPVIKGNFDIHFFPRNPVAVLDTTLAAILRKKEPLFNVRSGTRSHLPSFPLIRDLSSTRQHEITLDVSGLPPEADRRLQQKSVPRLQNASWSGVLPAALDKQTPKNCQTSCNNNGRDGSTGIPGISPDQAPAGAPNGGPPAPDGSCSSSDSPNGSPGTHGGEGQKGGDAGDGGPGANGTDAGDITVDIAEGDTSQYIFLANGGKGGKGGEGGTGGVGGDGGAATDGGNGVACGCNAGSGGDGGKGGDAGAGGHGGNAGQGGNGGNGGIISGLYSSTGPKPTTSFRGGSPGDPGDAGRGGLTGNPGRGGKPGAPATACGVIGRRGGFPGSGNNAPNGNPGNAGAFGQSGGQLGADNLKPRTQIAGGGGGTTDPCLGGQTDPGSGFTRGGVDPTCSPIIVDTLGDGFSLTSAQAGVMFDISGSGHPIQLAWTERGSHNAFLALPAPDGLVHNGKQLFGNFTRQPASAHPNGFLALAEFDKSINGGNDDGIIDERDSIFSRLRLWIDENHDGLCQPNELHTLPDLGVFSLALQYRESRRTDDFGNQFRYKAKVNPDPAEGESDAGRWTYDIFLATVKK